MKRMMRRLKNRESDETDLRKGKIKEDLKTKKKDINNKVKKWSEATGLCRTHTTRCAT